MIQCDSNLKITMDYGDWGTEIPFSITGNITPADELVFFIAQRVCSNPIITKVSHANSEGYYSVILTKEDSKLLPPGKYLWGVHQFRNKEFYNSLTNAKVFEVLKGVDFNE